MLMSYWLEIPVYGVAAECGFSSHNKILRSRLSERKTQNQMTMAFVVITLDAFDYAQSSAQFKFQEEGLSSSLATPGQFT